MGQQRKRRLARLAAPAAVAAPPPTPRLVVVIPTHERPEMCLRLLQDLVAQRGGFDQVIVADDASKSSYASAVELVAELDGVWVRNDERHGKRGFWKTVNRLLWLARVERATEIVFLADDMRLCDNFFDRVREQWSKVEDPRKIAMNLLVDQGRVDKPCWTGITPATKHGGVHTGWIDGCFYGSSDFLRVVKKLDPIPAQRWAQDPTRSSGAWQAVSQKLVREKWGLYRCPESLVVHVAAPSAMNANSRMKNPILTHRFIDGPARARRASFDAGPVVATMASIPSRKKILRKTLDALLPQVDTLALYLNYGSEPTPAFLLHPKVRVYRADETQHGDLSDMGKFYPSPELDQAGYVVTVDDDLLYAPDYVERLLHHIEMHSRKVVVGYHGVQLLGGARANYYKNRKVWPCRRHCAAPHWVHVLGTGALAFARSSVELPSDLDMLKPGRNMADIWFGRLAQQQRVPLRVLAHTGAELTQQETPPGDSIFERMRPRSGAQSNLIGAAWPWQLWGRTANA